MPLTPSHQAYPSIFLYTIPFPVTESLTGKYEEKLLEQSSVSAGLHHTKGVL